jgi:hypothetical protein
VSANFKRNFCTQACFSWLHIYVIWCCGLVNYNNLFFPFTYSGLVSFAVSDGTRWFACSVTTERSLSLSKWKCSQGVTLLTWLTIGNERPDGPLARWPERSLSLSKWKCSQGVTLLTWLTIGNERPDGPLARWPQREAFHWASGSARKALLYWHDWL